MVLSPYIPLFYEYWPIIVTGIMCFLAAAILFKTTMESSTDDYSDPEPNFLDDGFDSEDDEHLIEEMYGVSTEIKHVDLEFQRLTIKESEERSEDFFKLMDKRRTVKYFSSDHVPPIIIQNIIKAAGTAPSGAHTEPWTYVVVSDPKVKERIREIIELDEKQCYEERSGYHGLQYKDAAKNLNSIWMKDYITTAPYLILVFKQLYSIQYDGKKRMHYYNEMSVAIAAGILLTAIHFAGLVSLTSTPLNSGNEIRKILSRPKNERLTLVVPVGYPAENATVPDLCRKQLGDIMVEI